MGPIKLILVLSTPWALDSSDSVLRVFPRKNSRDSHTLRYVLCLQEGFCPSSRLEGLLVPSPSAHGETGSREKSRGSLMRLGARFPTCALATRWVSVSIDCMGVHCSSHVCAVPAWVAACLSENSWGTCTGCASVGEEDVKMGGMASQAK